MFEAHGFLDHGDSSPVEQFAFFVFPQEVMQPGEVAEQKPGLGMIGRQHLPGD